MPASYHCAEILNVELDSPTKKPSAAAALVERLGWHPIAHQELIPYTLLLQMFQHLYGNRLESVKFITMDLLRIADPGIVSCRAAVCRFDKRDTWRVYKSRPGPHDRFYCAPHIEIILPFFPTRAAAKGVIEAIQNSWAPLGKHMQPAYKFRTRTYSWKFEPGMVYESVNAGHLIAKPIIHEHQQDEITQEDEEQDEQPDGNLKLITYPDQKIEEERFETDPGDWPKTLDDIKEEIRSGPNKNQCKELVKSTLADQFKLDPRRITVWFWTREVQQSDGKWYPWGSLDNTHGLVLASREVDQCKEGDARRRVRRNSRSSRDAEEKEPRDIAPTIRIIMPVERTDFAKNDENVNGLKECVDRIRLQLSAPSAFHSRAAFCISWKKERREFADWFVPQVIYKPTGDGDDYVLQSTLGSEK
ncbi:hypothetical protein NUW58_g2499 [Xylaria curta]|uniref:Uncharacterized protein n=1 Tax=Xylaria curta TaxID=42375 RepID=A0ACC1PF73_9PEZI|nr:hypothetical protein NUW58_g2499 [Xylaria curta]